MATIVNPNWVKPLMEKLNSGGKIDETISFNKAAQWLIEALQRRNRPFRIFNLGAGVKRITTDTDKCPCCQKLL